MTRMVCVECRVYLKPFKNGVTVIKEDEYMFAADVYECPECGTQIIAAFGDGPKVEHYQSEKWQAYMDGMRDEERYYVDNNY